MFQRKVTLGKTAVSIRPRANVFVLPSKADAVAPKKRISIFSRREKTRRRSAINPIPDNLTGHSLFSATTTFSGNQRKKTNRSSDSGIKNFIRLWLDARQFEGRGEAAELKKSSAEIHLLANDCRQR